MTKVKGDYGLLYTTVFVHNFVFIRIRRPDNISKKNMSLLRSHPSSLMADLPSTPPWPPAKPEPPSPTFQRRPPRTATFSPAGKFEASAPLLGAGGRTASPSQAARGGAGRRRRWMVRSRRGSWPRHSGGFRCRMSGRSGVWGEALFEIGRRYDFFLLFWVI